MGAFSNSNINTEERTRITEHLVERAPRVNNINITIRPGETLTEEVPLAELPDDVVHVAPQYRGYRYFVVRDEIVIVEPRTKKIVDVIRSSGGAGTQRTEKINLSPDKRTRLKTEVLRQVHERATKRIVIREGERLPPDVEIIDLPADVLAEFPELRGYRIAIIEDEVVLVEPETRQVVEVIQ
ncbi:DUF1236 domain-containing protein [Microvirga sp. 2TAF3]|uniref:DUF1236 domain-containing protein n=1 Tax=Microvirga sp. 2TAF3 TaxID=3233014 RepID=UPI003F98CAFA